MYKWHPVFRTPAARTVLWRYMDFTKLLWLLENSALYFARSDSVGDPFEGSVPSGALGTYGLGAIPLWDPKAKRPSAMNQLRIMRRTVFLSCWHKSKVESAALWSLYLKSDEGCAVRTTVGKLKRCLTTYEENDIQLGAVHYIDYGKDGFRSDKNRGQNLLSPFVHKRLSFKHEQEVRAVLWDTDSWTAHHENLDHQPPESHSVPVELPSLVDAIYVSPTATKWFVDLVSASAKRYGLPGVVRQSDLNRSPFY